MEPINRLDRAGTHVTPDADLIDHCLRPDCICGPRCEPVTREDGSVHNLYVHRALDGRGEYRA